MQFSIWKEAILCKKGTVPDLRTEQSEVVGVPALAGRGLSLANK
jgi:hypothetical protein